MSPGLATDAVLDSYPPPFVKRMLYGFSRAMDMDAVAPCHTFGESHPINMLHLQTPHTADFPNPWHIGVLDPATYPEPYHLIQSELELLVFMFALVLELKPRLVVETGTNIGLMARTLGWACWVNNFGRVVTCDTDQRMCEFATTLCAGLPVQIWNLPALELPELREADLVFIDSSYESRSAEIHLVKPGAVYIYHDSYAEPWIRPEMMHEKYKVHLDSPRGFSIVRKA